MMMIEKKWKLPINREVKEIEENNVGIYSGTSFYDRVILF